MSHYSNIKSQIAAINSVSVPYSLHAQLLTYNVKLQFPSHDFFHIQSSAHDIFTVFRDTRITGFYFEQMQQSGRLTSHVTFVTIC